MKRPPKTDAEPASGEVLAPVKVGRLETVRDWHRQIAKIYRAMRRGEMRVEDGPKLGYVAEIGARLAKAEQELRELVQLREQVARLQGRDAAPSTLLSLDKAFDSPASVQLEKPI